MDNAKIEGIKELDRLTNKLAKSIKKIPTEIVKTLSTVRNNILNRTISGKDADGTAFTYYQSELYIDKRREKNRPIDRVTLSWTGNMLRSMKAFNIKDGGEIKFDDSSANDRAVKHNEGRGRLPKREFFGLSKDNILYIEKKIGKRIPL